jgi:hypothetical protein
MAITKISGVLWANLAKVGGIAKASITDIGGASAGSPPGPSCTTVYYGYSDGRRGNITDACFDFPQPYEYDPSTGALYSFELCGVVYAESGYYAGNGAIFFFDGNTLQFYDVCPR